MKKNSSHKTLSIVKRISITNIGIFIIACILSIVATLKLNVEYHIDRDAQMMKVYISNTLSSIDNTLKDMGRVSLIAFSDQTVQDILKGTDYSFDEKMENEEYLKKLYSSMISIRDDVRGIYIFNNEDMVFYSDTWNPFLGFDWNVESFFQDVKINSDLSTNISGCHMYVGTLPEGFKYTQTYTFSRRIIFIWSVPFAAFHRSKLSVTLHCVRLSLLYRKYAAIIWKIIFPILLLMKIIMLHAVLTRKLLAIISRTFIQSFWNR